MRLGGLCRDDHVRAVARRAKADGKADAARAAGDEERFAAKGHAVNSPAPGLPSSRKPEPLIDTLLEASRADRDVLGKEAAQRDPSRMSRIRVAARDERGCGERHVGKRCAALRQREQAQIRRRAPASASAGALPAAAFKTIARCAIEALDRLAQSRRGVAEGR